MICPNCGNEAEFSEHSAHHTETHGLDCGPYEHWDEEWVTCNSCGAKTDWDEIGQAQPMHNDPSGPRTADGIVGLLASEALWT